MSAEQAVVAHPHFNWWQYSHIELLDKNHHLASALTAFLVLVFCGIIYKIQAPKLSTNDNEKALVPPSKFNVLNMFDLLGQLVHGIAKDNIGHGYEKHFPLLLFIFIWILFSNLLGNIPGFGSSTDNINTTLSLGILVFVYYNFMGFWTSGIKYFQNLAGHLSGWLLLIMGLPMLAIELISHSIRPFTLGIRLRSNIHGDHTIFGVISDMVQSIGHGTALGSFISSVLPVPIMILGLLVCLIQALVFTILTSVYIGLAVAHDDDHH